MRLYHLGWKVIVATASDLIASAGRPAAFVLSAGFPPETSVEAAYSLVEGAADAAEALGAWLAGGDTNASREGWVDAAGLAVRVARLGYRPSPGDVVYTTVGRYGLTGLAFHLLARGEWHRIVDYPEALRATTKPLPRLMLLELLEELGGCVELVSDVSDGFFATLEHVATTSRLYILLERLPPLHPEAERYARNEGLDPEELLVKGGEEYEAVIVVRGSCTGKFEELADKLGLRTIRIGRLSSKPTTLDTRAAGQRTPTRLYIKAIRPGAYTGWDQFKGWT